MLSKISLYGILKCIKGLVSENPSLVNVLKKGLKTLFKFSISKSHVLHSAKTVHIRSYSGLHFPAFGLNTETYGVSLLNLNLSENGKSQSS